MPNGLATVTIIMPSLILRAERVVLRGDFTNVVVVEVGAGVDGSVGEREADFECVKRGCFEVCVKSMSVSMPSVVCSCGDLEASEMLSELLPSSFGC